MAELTFNHAFKSPEHEAFYDEGSNSAAVVLIHGFPGSPAEMRPMAEPLHALGFTVHAPRLAGFGADLETLPTRHHSEWVADVANAVKRVREGHKHVYLVGTSMGGALAIQAAARFDIAGIVLYAPFWRVEHVLWYALPLLKTFVPQFKPFTIFKPNFDDPKTRESIARFLPEANLDDHATRQSILDFSVSVQLFDQIRQVGLQGYAYAPRVKAAVRVIQGLQDTLVLPSSTRRYITRFTVPVQYDEIDGEHNLLDTDAPNWHKVRDWTCQFIHHHYENSS